MVAGTIPELISPTLIVQSWRTVNSHHNDPDSILIMPFTAIGNEGQVDLIHVKICHETEENTIHGK